MRNFNSLTIRRHIRRSYSHGCAPGPNKNISRPQMYVRLHTCGVYGWCIQKYYLFKKQFIFFCVCPARTYAWVVCERCLSKRWSICMHTGYISSVCKNMWSQFRSQCYQLTLTDSKTGSNQPQHYDHYGATKFSFVLQI